MVGWPGRCALWLAILVLPLPAVPAGQSDKTVRQISVVPDSDYKANNDLEMFEDARNEATAASRISRGQ